MTIVRLRGLFFACRLPIHKGRGVGCGVTQATEADKLKSCSALLKPRFSGSEDKAFVFIGDTVRFLRLTLLASSSASSTYVYIRLRSLLLAASLSFGIEAI